MNFYEEIAHKLYVWNTTIEETDFEPFDFIEAKHNEAPFKGKVFYQNLIHAMPKHFGAKMRNDFFKEVLQYCKIKIDNIDKPKQTEFQFTYEQEVTEERKNALQKRLAKLKTAEEKILFLRDEKAKYLQNISARTLEVSGSVHANFAPNAELFFDRYIQIEIDKLESLKKNYNNEVFDQTSEHISETDTLSNNKDEVLSIEQYFKDCKSAFNNEKDYLQAIQEIEYFFSNGNVKIKKPIFVKNGNMRKIAFAMGEIWRSRRNDVITFEYLTLYKKLFSVFDKHKIDKNHLFGCNLYKYSISKT
jgi:hypothetical protein